jgi:predicted MPP superfamily phosphohydrolase
MMLLFILPVIADIWLWYALISDLKRRSFALRAFVLAVKTSLSLALLYLIISVAVYGGDFAEPANAYRFITLSLTGMLLITTGMTYLFIRLIISAAGRMFRKKTEGAVLINITLFLLLVILVADGHFRQRLDIRVVRQDIDITGLDPALSGMKIVFISDLHLSSWHGSYDRLEDIVTMINREEPDLLINTGDFISYGWQEFGRCDTILRKAHARYGAFAVAGNHDDGSYYPGYDDSYGEECDTMMRQRITASGYMMLSDTSVTVNCRGTDIAVAGVVTHGHHLNMRYGDFARVLGEIPDSTFSILLLHDPAGWDKALEYNTKPDITLSGHTHGMQLGLPGGHLSPAAWIHKRWKGLYSQGHRYLYVTSGLGTMGMSVRIFMPPEVVVITLKAD